MRVGGPTAAQGSSRCPTNSRSRCVAGCPIPLRLLAERYPRIGWEAHPHFTALTRFWLDRHLGFRRMQAMLADDTRASSTGARRRGSMPGGSTGWRGG